MRLLGHFKPFIIFLRKDFASTKSTKSTKSPKSTKTQPSKSTKRYKLTKIKNAPKKHLKENSNLFAYLRFCARAEKKIRKKRKVPRWKCTKYRCPHNSVNVLTHISTSTELWGQLTKTN